MPLCKWRITLESVRSGIDPFISSSKEQQNRERSSRPEWGWEHQYKILRSLALFYAARLLCFCGVLLLTKKKMEVSITLKWTSAQKYCGNAKGADVSWSTATLTLNEQTRKRRKASENLPNRGRFSSRQRMRSFPHQKGGKYRERSRCCVAVWAAKETLPDSWWL